MRKFLFMMSCLFASPLIAEEADYPQDYRSWQHTKSGIIQPDHPVFSQSAGLHHIYANALALEGLRSNQYKEGAVFVVDFFSLSTKDHITSEDKRIRIDVMQFNPGRFSETDGWGYASFKQGAATRRVEQDTVTTCHACHMQRADSQFVFSKYRQ